MTVKIKNANETVESFIAAEVKAEKKSLDVITIEQLCMKLADMPKVTHKSIFSCSGYTKAALKKAKQHSVELYTIMSYDKSIGEVFCDLKGVRTLAEFLYCERRRP